jgi:polyisoprenoid-binding protein YceI
VRLASLALLLAVGCGAGVQQATITAPTSDKTAAQNEGGERWTLVPERSRMSVVGVDIVGGKHPVTFERWSGTVTIGPPNRVAVEIDMTSARGESETITRLLKYELLHVDRHPYATLEGTIDDKGLVKGNAKIHGVQRGLEFHGTLTREGAEYHFVARFKILRNAFDIRAEASWDSFIKDDVHIYVDVRAKRLTTPEGARPAD